MVPDGSPDAAGALTADAKNRAQYIACQRQVIELGKRIKQYIDAGLLIP